MGSSIPRYALRDSFAADAYVGWSTRLLAGLYPECDWAAARISYLDAGIMNYVYRVELPERTFFLKQALERVKEHDRIGPDLAEVSPARIQAEANALYFLEQQCPEECGLRYPRVAWHDTGNNVLWTEALAVPGASLHAELLAERCDAEQAADLGRWLARVQSLPAAPWLWGSAEADEENWERFLRMRTTGAVARPGANPAAQKAARALAREARLHARPGMLSHLDAAPKNVLLQPAGPAALLDYELGAAVADPAYDAGFLTGHYLLLGTNFPAMTEAARAAAAALQASFRSAAGDLADPGWEDRVRRYAGLVLLYRLFGSSPAPYLDPERYPAIEAEGIRLLLERDTGSAGS